MKKNKISISKTIIDICLLCCCIAFLVIIILRKSIFEPGTLLASLYEPVNDANIIARIIKSVIVLMYAMIASYLVKYLVKFTMSRTNRLKTAGNLLTNLTKYAAAIVAVIAILSVWGVDTKTLIASAGIVTLIIGLGCQSLVSDIVAGLFIIFEGDFLVGDVVVIDGWRGTVQAIGIRTTKIIDAAGNVKIINNSNISDIVNNTKELSLAICVCSVEYGDSLERIEKVIEKSLPYIKERIPDIVEGPYYKGVEELAASGVVIKLIALCKEEDKYQVQRDMNRELKLAFDRNNVNIPFPQVVLNQPTKFVNNVYHNSNQFVDEQREKTVGIEEENVN